MKDKKFYKIAIKMAWPSVLESFFIALAGMIDTMMVGSLGNFAIASVGLTTQPKFIGFTIFFALNVALSALVARRRGQEDRLGANEVFMTAMTISLVLCLIISILMVSFASPIMELAGSNPDTHEPAVEYFQIIMGGMIFNIVAMCINSAQRGSGNTKIAFITNLVSSIVNIVFNYLLIGGNFGFPALGIKGAAIATVFGSFVAMVMSIRSLFHRHILIEFKYIRKKKIRINLATIKSLFDLASTMFVENIAVRIGFLATALTAAKLGTDAFAAHNAGMNILSLGFSFGDGMQVAAVALAGKSLGENKPDLAIKYGYICQRIGFVISIILSILLLAFGKNIMALYFTDLHVIDMGLMITRFIMVIVLLQISQLIFAGCLRSGGDVKYTMITGFVSVTLVRTAVTLIAVNVFNLGLAGIWIGVLADQASRFIMFGLRFRGNKWTKIAI